MAAEGVVGVRAELASAVMSRVFSGGSVIALVLTVAANFEPSDRIDRIHTHQASHRL